MQHNLLERNLDLGAFEGFFEPTPIFPSDAPLLYRCYFAERAQRHAGIAKAFNSQKRNRLDDTLVPVRVVSKLLTYFINHLL